MYGMRMTFFPSLTMLSKWTCVMFSITDAICFKHHFILVAFFLQLFGLNNILL